MSTVDIILKKKRGEELSSEDINYIVSGYTKGEIPDYQISALLMAVCFNKMNERETYDLTMAMARSGDMLDLSRINGVKTDKHSSGGVGDKTTLVLAPIIAACSVPVAKMSGRGLGHTGGTIDKLESIPGFRTTMSDEDFINKVNKHKIAVVGQTANLAPADKKLYALRDVTGTVDNQSLIASSIMSKKIASGADAIVLDVKCGSGAFMKDIESATNLARMMVDIGKRAGRKVCAAITNMDQPLGYKIGNSLEVEEAIDTLKGKGPKDLTLLCYVLGSRMLYLANAAESIEKGADMVKEVIENGKALAKFEEFVEIQGGNRNVTKDYSILPTAKYTYDVIAQSGKFVKKIDAEMIGKAVLKLGGGRLTKESKIDLSVGIELKCKVSESTKDGHIATVYSSSEEKAKKAVETVLKAYTLSDERQPVPKLLHACVD